MENCILAFGFFEEGDVGENGCWRVLIVFGFDD